MDKEIFVKTETLSVHTGYRGGEDIGGSFGAAVASTGMKLVAVSADALREQFSNLVEVVEYVFDRSTPAVTLDEVELSVEITAEGKVSLLGSGATGGGRGGIKMTFKRNNGSAAAATKANVGS
ncbi:Pepco domain-containing protein [Rhizobium grahamii]|uniref:Pepco domain-containing protein n=2 Tax=Rhizobium grahamii TaxID=1120045 RepID=S3H9D4_9HYPH|nr:hypothetical protein [Rhizobium grahamii]EPE94815.1 hypothetical protein RGCCGE502_29943 [Rhizobium grahamii CCGE 502]RDJ05604.1 hypothetical protein B5K06_24385 [Rhizobium grahamii]